MRILLAFVAFSAGALCCAHASPVDDFRTAVTKPITAALPDERYSVRPKEPANTRPARERHVRFLNALVPGRGFRIGVGGKIDLRNQRDYETTPAEWMKFACSAEADFSAAMLRWSHDANPFRRFTEAFDNLMATLERDAKTKTDPAFLQFFGTARKAQEGLEEIVRGQKVSSAGREGILRFLASCGVG